MKADFSEAIIRGRKESARDRGSRVNDGNLRPAMASASESEIARRTRAKEKVLGERERERRIRGKAQRGDDTVEKNGENDRPKNKRIVCTSGITYVRPEHDAVIIVNRRGGENAGEMKRGGLKRRESGRVFVRRSFEERAEPRQDEVSPGRRNRLIIRQILFLTYT